MSHNDVDIAAVLNPNNNVSGGFDNAHVVSDEQTDAFTILLDKRTDSIGAGAGGDYGYTVTNVGNLPLRIEMLAWYVSTNDSQFRNTHELGERQNDGSTPTALNEFWRQALSNNSNVGFRRLARDSVPNGWLLNPDEHFAGYATYGNEGAAADDVRAEHMLHGTVLTDTL